MRRLPTSRDPQRWAESRSSITRSTRRPAPSASRRRFPNASRSLWPGQFVNVTIRLSTDPRAMVVPSVAVQAGPEGQYVYVVKSDQTVEMRKVTVKRTAGVDTILTRRRESRRDGRHRRAVAARTWQPHQRQGTAIPKRRIHEPLSAVHQTSHHHNAHHARHSGLRRDVVPGVAGGRPAGHRFPDDIRERLAARRKSRDDGVGRRAAARKTVLDNFRSDVDELVQHAGQHEHHVAVRPEPQHRRGGAGRPDDDRPSVAAASAADAVAAVVLQGEPRRLSGHDAGHAVGDTSAVDGERIRRLERRAAHFHGERGRAGQCLRPSEVCRPHRRRSTQALGAWHRHR